MTETTVAATLASDMLRFLERHGHSIVDVCRLSGLDPGIMQRPDERIPGSRMAVLWSVAVSLTGDPLVAMRMADEFHPAALDILGYVVLTCATLGDALACLARYAGLLNDGLRVHLEDHGPTVVLRLEIVASHRTNALLVDSHHAVEAMWVGLARQLRNLTAIPVIPLAVSFRHVVRDADACQRLLGAPVQFGASDDLFVVVQSDLARPLPSANPALLTVFEQHAESLLRTLGSRDSFVSRVSHAVVARMKGRLPTIGDIASELAMSTRNLQRALHAEGQTYQQVLDEVRQGLARRYLADESNTVSQVAFLLGYSEAAAFHRAFRKWTGITPAAARRNA